MADRNERVMEMVRKELGKNPDVDTEVLFGKAKEIDPAVAEMSKRQFHARYPLQIKRSRERTGPREEKRAPKSGRSAPTPRATRRQPAREAPSRDAIRDVFLAFASDFAQAESRQEIVRVLSSVDQYVDRVQKLVSQK